MFKRNGKSGFTLLELLIVVIIVSILAAVALPQFGKMTKRAKVTEGFNTVGAILTAQSIYFQEKSDYADAIGDLLVDIDQTKFTLTSMTAAAGPPKQVTVVLTGTTLGPGTGVTVTGVVDANGKRTISTAG